MKKTSLLLIAGLVLTFIPQQVQAIDIGGVTVNPIGYEAGLIKNHDMQMMNQKRFELEKSREYQSQQKVNRQENELKEQFNTYKSQKNSNPTSNMEFMQSKDGSIIIKEAQ